MTDTNQKQLGSTLWSIADQLRGAMDADDFRDYTAGAGVGPWILVSLARICCCPHG
jgi:type I restriction-modification system DNA methylase subunit